MLTNHQLTRIRLPVGNFPVFASIFCQHFCIHVQKHFGKYLLDQAKANYRTYNRILGLGIHFLQQMTLLLCCPSLSQSSQQLHCSITVHFSYLSKILLQHCSLWQGRAFLMKNNRQFTDKKHFVMKIILKTFNNKFGSIAILASCCRIYVQICT